MEHQTVLFEWMPSSNIDRTLAGVQKQSKFEETSFKHIQI